VARHEVPLIMGRGLASLTLTISRMQLPGRFFALA
jgi:hypothetical protein